VTAINELDHGNGNVFLEGSSTCWDRDRVVFAPDGEDRWPVLAKVILEVRIELFTVSVIVEDVELDFSIALALHHSSVQMSNRRRC